MKLVIDEKLRKVDSIFFGVFKYLNLIRHVNPINVVEEKELFLSGERRNPFFKYKEPRHNIEEIRIILKKLDIPDNDLGRVFEKIRGEFLMRCEIIENIGINDHVVKELSSRIYGWPNEWLIESAKDFVKETPCEDVSLNVSSERVHDSLKSMMDEVGLDDWIVKYSEKWLTRTKYNKKILLCKTRKFSELDVSRLPVHEVGVHAVRYANGYLQPLMILGYGFPDFLKTEEGLAMYFEEFTGNSSGEIFRNYAGRVLAIDCLKRNFEFRECFNELKGYGFDDDDSWNLSVRVYRGGGFVKDHVYLEGYILVKKFIEDGGDLKKLFVGKVGIEDLDFIDSLLGKGLINEPHLLPPFLK